MSFLAKREREDDGGSQSIHGEKRANTSPNNINKIEKCFLVTYANQTLCSYCSKDIKNSIKIICAECPNTPVFCFDCLSNSKGEHGALHEHDYHIVDKMNFPLFTSDWSLQDELRLLASVEKYGLDNWGDISDNMRNRGKVECESHYYSFYYRSKDHKLPNENTFVIKHKEGTINNLNDNIDHEKVKENIVFENNIKEKTKINQGIIPEPSLLIDRTSKRGRCVIKNINKKDQSTIQSAGEILGYWPKREEFDIEFLNDAELEIAELEFLDEDSVADRNLKTEVLKAYNAQLNERQLRKDFIIKKNLLDLRRQMNYESKLSKEDREILNCIKPFARFYDYSDFFDLHEGLVLEKNLKQKLFQLKQYQKQGLKTIEDIQKHLDIDMKNPKKPNLTSQTNGDAQLFQQPLSTSSLGERVSRFIKYNNSNETIELLTNDEQEFVKELPISKTMFYDIKAKIKNEMNSRAKTANTIENIVQGYEIEKQTMDNIITFFNNEKALQKEFSLNEIFP